MCSKVHCWKNINYIIYVTIDLNSDRSWLSNHNIVHILSGVYYRTARKGREMRKERGKQRQKERGRERDYGSVTPAPNEWLEGGGRWKLICTRLYHI